MMAVKGQRQGFWWLALCPIAAFAFLAGQIESQESLLHQAATFQFLYAIGFVGYLVVIWTRSFKTGMHHPREAVVVLAAGIGLRLLIFTGPASDDLHRYVWEGRIQWDGHNPYALAPDDPRLDHLRDGHWPAIPRPHRTAIAAPLSEMVFAAVAAVYPAVGAMKAVALVWDILTLLLLAAWLHATGRTAAWLAVYALSPLTLTAFAMEGHVDSMMLAWLALAGFTSMRRRWLLCGLCVGLAVLSHTIAAVLLIWLLWRSPRAALTALTVVLVGYMPYADAGPGLIAALIAFGTEPFFNSLVPPLLASFLDTRAVTAGCILFVAVATIFLATERHELHRFGVRLFGLLLVMLPVVHFWYVSWLLLFLGQRLRWRWIVLSGSMVFYFDAWLNQAETGVWRLPTSSYWLIWGPFLVTWVAEELGRFLGDRQGRQPPYPPVPRPAAPRFVRRPAPPQ